MQELGALEQNLGSKHMEQLDALKKIPIDEFLEKLQHVSRIE